MTTTEEKRVHAQKEMEQKFASMERDLAAQGAGLLDVLKVYGGYEAALDQAAAYLSPLNSPPAVVSAAGTGVQPAE